MATNSKVRDWREVARLARKRFDSAFSNNKENNSASQSEEKENPKNSVFNNGQEAHTFRRNSMHIPRSHAQEEDFFRRASWAAPKQTSSFGEARRAPPPPPPPRKMHKGNDLKQAEAAPETNPTTPAKQQYEKRTPDENEPNENIPTSEIPSVNRKNGPTFKDTKPLTPLQERPTNQATYSVPPLSAKKAGSEEETKLAPKPFAALLKENRFSYYELLEISENATEKEILKAYRSWAKCVHPDHNKSPTATEDFQALQHIHEVLKVPKTRLAYNCRQKIRRCAFGSRPRPQTYV